MIQRKPPIPFKAGDRVRINAVNAPHINNRGAMIGKTGVVAKVIKTRKMVRIALTGGGDWEARPENLENLEGN